MSESLVITGMILAGNRVRVSQSVNGITENRFFLLDSGHSGYEQIFEETNTVGGIPVRSYVIGNKIVSQTNRSSTYYFLYDGHGNTRQLLDTDSQIQESYGYDAYGQLLGGTPNSTDRSKLTEFLYTGEQFDSALQMWYLRMRYYAANTGTFNRLGPYIGDINDPLSLNKYGYAHADPINGIDPSGESLVSLLMNMTYPDFYIFQYFICCWRSNRTSCNSNSTRLFGLANIGSVCSNIIGGWSKFKFRSKICICSSRRTINVVS